MSRASFILLCQLPHPCQARRGGTEVLHSLDATGIVSVRVYGMFVCTVCSCVRYVRVYGISLLNPHVHVNFIMVFFP